MISISKKTVVIFTACLFVMILFFKNTNKNTKDGSAEEAEASQFLQNILSNNNEPDEKKKQHILHALQSEMMCSDYKPNPFDPALINLMKDFGKHECHNTNELKLTSKGNDLVEVSAYKLNFVNSMGIKVKNDAFELSEKKQVTKPEFPETILQIGKCYISCFNANFLVQSLTTNNFVPISSV